MTSRELGYALTAGLVVTAACRGDLMNPSLPSEGAVRIATVSTGADLDDRYLVTIHTGTTLLSFLWIPPNFTYVMHVPAGPVTLEIGDLAGNCATNPDSARTIDAVSGDTVRVAWTVSCSLITPHRLLFEDWAVAGGEIYVRNPGTGLVVNVSNSGARDTLPAWAPDGSAIVFVSRRTGNDEIFTVRPDGSGLTNLTNNSAAESDPAWSPDGTRIAFVSNRDGNREIYMMNADGSGQIRLTSDTAPDNTPAWSPDGTRIAFLRGCVTVLCARHADLCVMSAEGAEPHRIAWGWQPAWSPDGRRVAGVLPGCGGYYGSFDAFLVNPDGTDWLLLTRGHNVGALAWSPR